METETVNQPLKPFFPRKITEPSKGLEKQRDYSEDRTNSENFKLNFQQFDIESLTKKLEERHR